MGRYDNENQQVSQSISTHILKRKTLWLEVLMLLLHIHKEEESGSIDLGEEQTGTTGILSNAVLET